MITTNNNSVFDRLLSDENIYQAIYSVDSYIFNVGLLSNEDKLVLYKLKDKFNYEFISSYVDKVKERIKELFDKEYEYLRIEVYFNPKKFEVSEGIVSFRPIHSASLLEQIVMVALLNIVVYDVDKNNQLLFSNVTRILPNNFYGNAISLNPSRLFERWDKQYKAYTNQINNHFERYHETNEYEYEISLDLKNFFPSINPKLIYSYIAHNIPVSFSDKERRVFLTIIKILLSCEVSNLANDEDKRLYYGIDNTLESEPHYFVKGLPQGLAHAYFFGNICMIGISNIFNESFKGKHFYYVDDSVIFTDCLYAELSLTNHDVSDDSHIMPENIELFDFRKSIEKINKMIDCWSSEVIETLDNSDSYEDKDADEFKYYKFDDNFRKFLESSNFQIQVHGINEKSSYTKIKESDNGERYLINIGREASMLAFELNTSYSDEENKIIQNKVKASTEIIENELNIISKHSEKNNNNSQGKFSEAYKRKLIRYKKFFNYRLTLLQYREDQAVEQIVAKLLKDLGFLDKENSQSGLVSFFEMYNDDVIGALLSFVFKNIDRNNVEANKLVKKLNTLNMLLFNRENLQTSYIIKIYVELQEYSPIYITSDYNRNIEYKTLQLLVKKHIPVAINVYESLINSKIKEILDKFDAEVFVDMILGSNLYSISAIVRANTDEILRMVMNAAFSWLFQIEISNDVTFTKYMNRKITYKEIRILSFLRNKKFTLSDFNSKVSSFISPEYEQSADYSIFQVMRQFKTYVSNPNNIDILILVHKYTSDIWKNGSKMLYFYTLHNQEHAVELIENSIKLVRAISLMQITTNDYFILFMACYLHDISMISLPRYETFLENGEHSNEIASEFTDHIKKIKTPLDMKQCKVLLKDYYIKIDEFFEGVIRDSHALDSATEIRREKSLEFIDINAREFAASVAEAHGYDTKDIYSSPTKSKNGLVNLKYMKIILRLADCLDINNYRVSTALLSKNANNMPLTSRYHWISHLVTKGFGVETEYVTSNKIGSLIGKNIITEHIKLTVVVELSQLTKVKKKEKCKWHNLTNITRNGLELKVGESCSQKDCNFLCKWFSNKNKYLIVEFAELKNYFNNDPRNYYLTEISIHLKIDGHTKITNEQFDTLEQYLKTSD